MRNLVAYIMRGRLQAIWVALLFTLIPFFGWMGDVIVALITLRKGAKEGLIILLWVILPSLIVGFFGYPQLWLYDVLGMSIATFILAVILHHYNAWGMVMQAGMLLGIAAILIVHMLVPDLMQVWDKNFAAHLQTWQQQKLFKFDMQSMQQDARFLLQMATGIQVAFLLIVNFFNLVIARWGQSIVYNPGALRQELYNVRLSVISSVVLGVVIILALLGWAPAIDSIPVVILVFLLAGLSLLHFILAATKKSNIWLMGFYVLLILLFPYMAVLLVLAALVDSGLNLREKFQIKN